MCLKWLQNLMTGTPSQEIIPTNAPQFVLPDIKLGKTAIAPRDNLTSVVSDLVNCDDFIFVQADIPDLANWSGGKIIVDVWNEDLQDWAFKAAGTFPAAPPGPVLGLYVELKEHEKKCRARVESDAPTKMGVKTIS